MTSLSDIQLRLRDLMVDGTRLIETKFKSGYRNYMFCGGRKAMPELRIQTVQALVRAGRLKEETRRSGDAVATFVEHEIAYRWDDQDHAMQSAAAIAQHTNALVDALFGEEHR